MFKIKIILLLGVLSLQYNIQAQVVPQELRGRVDAEREGQHDANRIRTMFYNFGMVGDYPADPGNVDYSIFHHCNFHQSPLELQQSEKRCNQHFRDQQGNRQPFQSYKT